MSKILGYILSVIGIAIIAIGSIKPLRATLGFIPDAIKDLYIMVIGLAIVIVGILFLYKEGSGNQKVTEVPIYHGKEVVGFRRLGKK